MQMWAKLVVHAHLWFY